MTPLGPWTKSIRILWAFGVTFTNNYPLFFLFLLDKALMVFAEFVFHLECCTTLQDVCDIGYS